MARRADRQRAAGDRRHRRACRSAAARIPAAHCVSRSIVMLNASNATSSTRACRSPATCWRPTSADLEFADGRFRVKGTDRSLGIFEVAAQALRAQRSAGRAARPARRRKRRDHQPRQLSPMAAMSARSRSTPRPGSSKSSRYTAVDDVGRAVNPMIVHGQIHGGIAHGVGQALSEYCVYDRDTGQLLSGSFYGLRDAARRPIAVLRRPSSARSRPRLTRSASARPAKAAPPRRSASSSMRSSMRSPNSASPTSRCRRPRNASGARSNRNSGG